ncbi:hypothetical protein N1028_00540 [Herbiconiux sp. CPCC 203407]|uniref:DUF6993 domain-containing protein n=1 Tax=Herbiconiux oxytropis TaxID=2970915 RepID=A0AA41XG96_9MICO|nr:hypothetical protein [Herbiconiux oxytropis]MCS5720899.1 hypothetical protein [Herbiconiux oxytropis]MCS5724376.1 hypothetical protein [Herbiconiux oxytropis]
MQRATSRLGRSRASETTATNGAATARRSLRWASAALVPAALLVVLTGCVPADGGATPATTAPPTSAAPTTPPAPDPTLQLLPEGTALENQPFFDSVNRTLIAANPAAGGVEFTSTLRDNGFDLAAMQVTPDITTVGVAADAVQFSVRWKDNNCLIGQYGHGIYTSTVAPALGTGACLVGQTRPIDW